MKETLSANRSSTTIHSAVDTPMDAFSTSDNSAHMHDEIHPNSHRNIIILDEEEEVEEGEGEEEEEEEEDYQKGNSRIDEINHTKGSHLFRRFSPFSCCLSVVL